MTKKEIDDAKALLMQLSNDDCWLDCQGTSAAKRLAAYVDSKLVELQVKYICSLEERNKILEENNILRKALSIMKGEL